MTATTARRFVARYDAWDLRILREAKAYRDEIGEVMPEMDAKLAEAERQHAAGTGASEPGAPADAYLSRVRGDAVADGARGYSNYSRTARPASDKQVSYLASLHRELGTTAPTPRDSKHASELIDAAKVAVTRARMSGTTAAPARTERKATEGQVSYLTDLLVTRVHEEGEVDPAGLSFSAASAMIDRLARAPRVRNAVAAHGIREGRYAFQPAEGAAQFYRVSRTGRISIVAGPQEHPYRGQLNEALRAIQEDPRTAAALYGQLIGSCGRCGRTLTDETSRSVGLGPDCASKGW